MAIKIISATRINAAPCQHYQVLIDDDGVQRSFETTIPELQVLLDDSTKKDLVLGWAKYKIAHGATLASLINVVIA